MSESTFQSLTEPNAGKQLERYLGELAMLVPVYVEGGGDMTKVVLRQGSSWLDPRPVPAVLKQVARTFGYDLTALRERYGDILGRKLHVPIPLSAHLVLIPFKMRTPRIQKDGTTGYVATHVVQRVLPDRQPTRCQLEIEGNGLVTCLQSSEFARQQLRNARIVQTFYREQMQMLLTV